MIRFVICRAHYIIPCGRNFSQTMMQMIDTRNGVIFVLQILNQTPELADFVRSFWTAECAGIILFVAERARHSKLNAVFV